MKKSINVEKSYNDMRIDRFIRSHLGNIPQGLIEKNLRSGKIKLNHKKVKSDFIGEKVLEHLKEFNEVAYLRYASVYKEFSDASDFEKEVAEFN